MLLVFQFLILLCCETDCKLNSKFSKHEIKLISVDFMKIEREIKSKNLSKAEGRAVNLAQKVKKKTKKSALSVLSITIFTSKYVLDLVVKYKNFNGVCFQVFLISCAFFILSCLSLYQTYPR